MLFIFSLFTTSFAHDPTPPVPENCQEVQSRLRPGTGGELAETYTGMCRIDVRFVNAPVPGDILRTLDSLSGILGDCVVKSGNKTADVMIEMVIDDSRAYYASVIPNDHLDMALCMTGVLERVNFPFQYTEYKVSWHFVYPIDLDALLGPLPTAPPTPLPSVNRGVPEINEVP